MSSLAHRQPLTCRPHGRGSMPTALHWPSPEHHLTNMKGIQMTSYSTVQAEPLLTPAEVATLFRVDPKTVTRWAKAGKLTSIRTLGGHRRYRETEVRALLAGIPPQRS
jgi:excisionase family DNA binding protein